VARARSGSPSGDSPLPSLVCDLIDDLIWSAIRRIDFNRPLGQAQWAIRSLLISFVPIPHRLSHLIN
jgi:hypothetical protein